MKVPSSFSARQFAEFVAREHERLELKTGLGRKPIQESMVALSNTDGGAIIVGVKDDRTVVGRRRDQGVDDNIHGAASDVHHVGRYTIREISVDGVPVVVIIVAARHDEVAQTSDGRVLVRRGGHNRALFGRDLFDLMSSRSLCRFETTDSGVEVTAVDPGVASDVARAHGWGPDTAHERWAERGLLHGAGSLTMAGALVLTDPVVSLAAAKFVVDVRVYEEDRGTSYVSRRMIGGPVQVQVESATDLVLDRIGTEMVVTGTRRHDVPRLPRRVVREVIANAVAHRSYEIDASPVVIEVRPGRVLVTSPGRLPDPVTVESLRQAQSARNHVVIDVLRRFGLAEDSGQGIDVIQDMMRLEMLAEPAFEEGDAWFAVSLPLKGLISTTERAWLLELERADHLRPEERQLILLLIRGQRLTNTSAREALGVDSTEARTRLKRLRDAGVLAQHGTRGRAYYVLGPLGPEMTDQQVVLEAARSSVLTNTLVRELTGLDRAGAGALLKRLVGEGRLVQHGTRRSTTYTRAPG